METPFAHIPHPLIRDGRSQLDRRNDALLPESAPIDGRNLGDLLQYLLEYARQINFYDQDHLHRDGDWAQAFQNSIPFQYAIIGGFGLDDIETRFEEVSRSIRRRLSFHSLNPLFDLLFDMAARLETWLFSLSNDTTGLKTAIENLIETNLRARMLKVIGLANGAGKWGYQRSKNQDNLEDFWKLSAFEIYKVDPAILSIKGSQKIKTLEALEILEEQYRTFFKGLQEIISIAQDEAMLEKTITGTEDQDHEPHLALIFSFLLLFKELQGNLNDLSTSHLDFFYRKTLHLKELPIVPDKAHLVFELAKMVETEVVLEKGERFKAGKDDNGQDIIFQLEDEIVLDKTVVADLRTIFIDQGESGAFIPDSLSAVYAAPVANSADGKGEKFAKGQTPSWKTTGASRSKWTNPDTGKLEAHPFARLGFVLASKVLFLREGKRRICVFIEVADDCLPQTPLSAEFDVWLSTEKGWIPTQPVALTLNGTTLGFEITLEPDFPPVIYPGAKLLESDYGHELPMIKLELKQQTNSDSPYYWLRLLQVSRISIDAYVCDLRNLVVQNDLSVMDPNKPFQPFGPAPKKNSSNFLIGSEEIFCKEWQAIDINIKWKDKPADFGEHYKGYVPTPSEGSYVSTVDVLSGKNWIPASGSPVRLFLDDGNRISKDGQVCSHPDFTYSHIENAGAEPCPVPPSIVNGYTNDLECGFLRLKLGEVDFLHEEYPKVLAAQLLTISEAATLNPANNVALGGENNKILLLNLDAYNDLKQNLTQTVSKTTATKTSVNNLFNGPFLSLPQRHQTAMALSQEAKDFAGSSNSDFGKLYEELDPIPNPPYTPLIESLSLDYHARATTANQGIQFIHLHPWQGTYEAFEPVEPASPTVLPCFIDEGALYIGLDQFKPGSILNLLFQMEPSTADPDTDKAVVCWEYLRGNTWKPLLPDEEVLTDGTKGLIQSGIARIAVPLDISNEKTTIMPPGLHWIKARALLRTPAISETLAVHAQAAAGIFVPAPENDLLRLSQPLEEGKIAKFVNPKAAVKGVRQPYPGFGGRPSENPDHFYQRISEHLRHKGRAISLYDYEALVLQAFPEVYKVKCITHTLGRRGEEKDYELCPGFVTVVVVPDLEKVNAEDIFQPRLPAATLQAIKEFLKKRMSPFIRLEVLNPIYETVAVTATIQFRKGKSENFYLKQLEKDVQAFLAPWSSPENRHDISFGGQVYYSLILDFIEKRPYVEYVLDLRISGAGEEKTDTVKAKTSRSVLTTAGTHQFKLAAENDLLPANALQAGQGIGYDMISE